MRTRHRAIAIPAAILCGALLATSAPSPAGEPGDRAPPPVPPPRVLAPPSDPATLITAIEEFRRIVTAAADARGRAKAIRQGWLRLFAEHPVASCWLMQDFPGDDAIDRGRRLAEEGITPAAWAAMTDRATVGAAVTSASPREPDAGSWLAACRARRTRRLRACPRRFVYTRHANIGSHFGAGWTHYAFNEALSESTAWNVEWRPGSELCLLTIDLNGTATTTTLLADPTGMIRDPEVSFDAARILFAWKRGAPGRHGHTHDDYHLYEMIIETGSIRQLTDERGVADYEPCYLPGGDIIFNSTRCMHMVDCWSTPVSNLYRCDADGRKIRRLTYDQVHNNHPRILNDGRIVYTRWEYNDRGQIYPQPLFVMRPDGTAQAALYGGNSWFPTSLLHPRALPGTSSVLAIASGHHTGQVGKLVEVDPTRGTEEADGIEWLAPRRPAKAVRRDRLGQQGDIFCHPWPVEGGSVVAGYGSILDGDRWGRRMHLCLVTAQGAIEILATDPQTSCNQPMALEPRARPQTIPDTADPTAATGRCYLQDIYAGPGLAGIARGTVKRLRVVALDYRAAGIGAGKNRGMAGSSAVCTPISLNSGSWDVKRVLGEMDLKEDGSAFFEVPARLPIYFQALDAKGHVIQTMRSWTTLQGGETQGCVGCHEHKAQTPLAYGVKHTRPAPSGSFTSHHKGFSFQREIQPILDRHCIRCHHDTARQPTDHQHSRRRKIVHDQANPPEQTILPSGLVTLGLDENRLFPDLDFRSFDEDQQSQPSKNEVSTVPSNPEMVRAFSLLGALRQPKALAKTKRRWSDAYLALTGAVVGWGPEKRPKRTGLDRNAAGTTLVNWISAQSAPTLLRPYTAGAHTSGLLNMLAAGHRGVVLSREEQALIACWIDLCVPFCGDYREAHVWTEKDTVAYERALTRRAELNPVPGDLGIGARRPQGATSP